MNKSVLMALGAMGGAAIAVSLLAPAKAGGPYRNDSGSMLPLVAKGDLIHCAQQDGASLSYGDLVVYRLPSDNRKLWLKMVVGLAGDTVQMKGGVLWINGSAVPQRPAGAFTLPGAGGKTVPQYEETLPGNVKRLLLDSIPGSFLDDTAPYTVPEGHVFVIGSNRDNSVDSRLVQGHGPVPLANIVCKARV
ncbi:MAG: hypothetical protein Kow0032_22060 [Methyloligellaceae bacterium]